MMRATWSIWKHFHTASYSEGEKCDLQILSNERGISKCYYDVQTRPWVSEVSCRCFALFAFFVQILVAATEQDEVPDAHPASQGSRQTGRPSSAAVSVCSASSLRVASLSSSNHVGHAAGYQKKRLREHRCRQDDTWGSRQNKQLLASISVPLKAGRGCFRPEARKEDFPWWVWSESLSIWTWMGGDGGKGAVKTAWLWMPDWWWDRGTELLQSPEWILNSFLNRTENRIGKNPLPGMSVHQQKMESRKKKKNLCLFTDRRIELVTYQWIERLTLS